jgi:DNA polymerase elongation subunit (family B)
VKILSIDIETAPNTAHVWGLFKQNIGINQVLDTGRVMCFASHWLGTKKPIKFWSEFHDDHESVIRMAHLYLDEADAVLSYNGERFDIPTLNKEFLKYKLPPPAPYHHIDLLKVAKRRFRFASNKMDQLAKELGVRRKVAHEGHELWIKCMNGEAAAWKKMKEYNIGDIHTLEDLYHRLLPWIDTHPNSALYMDSPTVPTCTNCGSHKVHSRGVQTGKSQAYTRYQCNDCGTWMRGRYTILKKNPNILTQSAG